MRPFVVDRRRFIGTAAASAVASTIPARLMAAASDQLSALTLPPPISPAERLARVHRAQERMRAEEIGTVIVESGPSLDYFSGIQWWRSERLTALVIPAEGDAIVVTPFFERPSIAEMLAIPADIRTWNEDEDPLRLVAEFIAERNLAALPVGMEETNRFWIADRLNSALPGVDVVSAKPVVRALRMLKTPSEIALMQAAATV